MDAFVWDASYQTDIEDIDDQHRQLVALTNHLGDLVAGDAPAQPVAVRQALEALTDYAHAHFSMENALMALSEVDARHIDRHLAEHHEFCTIVKQLQSVPLDSLPSRLNEILNYICGWLAAHILGTDQALARQIRLLRAGSSSEAAYEQGEMDESPAIKLLTQAISRLYRVLRERTATLETHKTQEATVSLMADPRPFAASSSELDDLEAKVQQLLTLLTQSDAITRECSCCAPAIARIHKGSSHCGMASLHADILAQIAGLRRRLTDNESPDC